MSRSPITSWMGSSLLRSVAAALALVALCVPLPGTAQGRDRSSHGASSDGDLRGLPECRARLACPARPACPPRLACRPRLGRRARPPRLGCPLHPGCRVRRRGRVRAFRRSVGRIGATAAGPLAAPTRPDRSRRGHSSYSRSGGSIQSSPRGRASMDAAPSLSGGRHIRGTVASDEFAIWRIDIDAVVGTVAARVRTGVS